MRLLPKSVANTVPFAAMGGLIFLSRGRKGFLGVTLLIGLLAGLGTWIDRKSVV
jgi:membrane associated rhomboid family serine protease